MKRIKIKIVFILMTVFLTWVYTNRFGYLDTFPRIQQTTESSDRAWKFEVYQRKLEWFNPFADSEIVFKIEDIKENRVYEQRIWQSHWSNGFDKYREYNVRFEKDVIIVNDFWVANKSHLKFEMCPQLKCLNEAEF